MDSFEVHDSWRGGVEGPESVQVRDLEGCH